MFQQVLIKFIVWKTSLAHKMHQLIKRSLNQKHIMYIHNIPNKIIVSI
jgi:hypothetical protein